MTEKRAAILQILQESEGHLPAEEIFSRARLRYPGMVLATVYNNLHALEKAGLILHIHTTEGPDVYDKTVCPHEHAFCSRCGRVMDVHLGDLAAEFSKKSGVQIDSYDLVLRTVCPHCRDNH